MIRKDDIFKVVFDPGADKREKGILRQITQCPLPLSCRSSLGEYGTGDTGCARL